MQAIEQISVMLPADMVARLRARVRAGDFRNESEAVEDALGAAEASNAILPELNKAEVEHWLRTEVVAICDEMDRDPSRGIPLQQVIVHFEAARAARGE